MSIFTELLARADAQRLDHWGKHAKETRAYYERHPDRLYAIVGEDAQGRVIRDTSRKLDVGRLCMPDWFEYVEGFYKGKPDKMMYRMPTAWSDAGGNLQHSDGAVTVDIMTVMGPMARRGRAAQAERHRQRQQTMIRPQQLQLAGV